jgi:hypothetical protein
MISGEARIVNFENLLSRFQQLPDKMLRALEDELVIGANEIRNRIINSMDTTPKTGHTYRWRACNPGEAPDYFVTIKGRRIPVKKRWKPHRASSKGNPPAVDTGNLKRSILMDARLPGEVEVGSTIKQPPYPAYLEKGTSQMKERPWLKPAVDAVTARIEENIKQRVLKAI